MCHIMIEFVSGENNMLHTMLERVGEVPRNNSIVLHCRCYVES